MKEIIRRSILIYLVLFITTVSFTSGSTSTLQYRFSELFSKLYESLVKVFNPETEAIFSIISDSTGMYIHMLGLALVSLFLGWNWVILRPKRTKNINQNIDRILAYYIGYVLLFYGFNKIFLWQFEFPNPNLLYLKVGDMPKDLLYWSSMGTSKLYNVLTGGFEVFAGVLLFFPKTRLLGFFISAGIFLQVFFINLGFDISVKLFSLSLLIFSALGFYLRSEITNYSLKAVLFSPNDQSSNKIFKKFTFIKKPLLLCSIFLLIVLIPYAKNNFNSASKATPYPNEGAYLVKSNNIPFLQDAIRIFIYENTSFSIENKYGDILSFPVQIDYAKSEMLLESEITTPKIHFRSDNNKIQKLIVESDTLSLEYLDTSSFRLREDSFHWTMD